MYKSYDYCGSYFSQSLLKRSNVPLYIHAHVHVHVCVYVYTCIKVHIHSLEVTKQLTCMRHSCCTTNQFCITTYSSYSTCLLLSNFQQISWEYLYTCSTAFTHASLMLSCLGTATTMHVRTHVHVHVQCFKWLL